MRQNQSAWAISLAFVAAVAIFAFSVPMLESNARREPLDALVSELLDCINRTDIQSRLACRSIASRLTQSLKVRRPREPAETPRLTPLNVYVIDSTVVYRRPKCRAEDVAFDQISLNVYPHDVAVLPRSRRAAGFISIDFSFREHGFILDGSCLAVRRLPPWAVKKIVTGHFVVDHGFRWVQTVDLPGNAYPSQPSSNSDAEYPRPSKQSLAALAACREQQKGLSRTECEPFAKSILDEINKSPYYSVSGRRRAFNIYSDGDTLLYWRLTCRAEDVAFDLVTLNVYAQDPSMLSEDRRGAGFVSLDFRFSDHGFILSNGCLASIKLPPWKVSRVVTGHYETSRGFVWHRELEF